MKSLRKEFIATLLQKKGVGPKTVLKLAQKAEFIDTIEELYDFVSSQKEKCWSSITLEEMCSYYKIVEDIFTKSADLGIGTIGYFDDEFPESLRECVDEEGRLSPPLLLYYRGNLEALKMHGIAIIGTRTPTKEGILAGNFFAKELATRNINIVSGLALGCDTAAHQGALEAHGVTTVFLANGLDWNSIYPKENLELAQQIIQNDGLLLSEYAVGVSCNRYNLVARDRLQAGLANGTIVIQTGIQGGTMHAVNATLSAGKPLYAVEYTSDETILADKNQGNLLLITERKAKPVGSKNINSIVETSTKNNRINPKQGELEFEE